MQEKDNTDFFKIKYAVPSYYDIYKYGGRILRDEQQGIKMMRHYFSGYFTEEQIRENVQQYNLKNIFVLIKGYFRQEYGYTADNIELNNRYQRTINSYIYNDKTNPAMIHIDELFESTMFAFFLSMFKWSKDFEDLEIYGNCYRYILFLMNEVCILGEMQGDDAIRTMMEILAEDLQVLQLAENCYWTVLAFSMAHEVAHAYFADIGRRYSEAHPEKEEFDADKIAYHIILKIIMDKKAKDIVLQPYTYLAPMMYMDFFDMVYYTDRVLYKTIFYDDTHPTLKRRKGQLFAIVDRDEYDFDTEEGNYLYRGFNQVYKEYKIQTIFKMKKGKLTKILRTKKREQMKEMMKEKDNE